MFGEESELRKGQQLEVEKEVQPYATLTEYYPILVFRGPPAQLIVEFCVICRRFCGQLSLFNPKDAKLMQVPKGI